jgi:hypothetical protein
MAQHRYAWYHAATGYVVYDLKAHRAIYRGITTRATAKQLTKELEQIDLVNRTQKPDDLDHSPI